MHPHLGLFRARWVGDERELVSAADPVQVALPTCEYDAVDGGAKSTRPFVREDRCTGAGHRAPARGACSGCRAGAFDPPSSVAKLSGA